MPNTLAHFGIQALATRLAIPTADPKIIFLGCVLPDVPWILQRIVRIGLPSIDPYSLRLYAIVQASLFMTLFLCGALASLSRTPCKVFAILSLSTVLHLLLDALQTKWANGVHLFAPFFWELLNFELFWPESLVTYCLTALGFLSFVWFWKQAVHERSYLPLRLTRNSFLLALGLFVIYFLLPVFLLHGPLSADNHSIRTLLDSERRVNIGVELDRDRYVKREDGDVLAIFTGEEFQTDRTYLDHSAVVSIRGKFVAPDMIQVVDLHEHSWWFRDGSTYVGLFMLVVIWAVALWKNFKSQIDGIINET